MAEKKLYRCVSDGKLAGVCAGIAKYFDLDPTVIRLIWVFVTFAGGSGLIAYIICALVIPEEPSYTEANWSDVNDSNQ